MLRLKLPAEDLVPWLGQYGVDISWASFIRQGFNEIPDHMVPVVLVSVRNVSVAWIAYDQREFERLICGFSARANKRGFYVNRAALLHEMPNLTNFGV